MGNSKKKRKFNREPQLSAISRAASKISKQDVVHRMVMKSLGSKTRGDVYGNDAIAVRPWMTEESLNLESRGHKKKISNNQLQQF